MKLKLARKWFSEKSTIGILYLNDKLLCYTLEDRVRPAGEKIQGETAIPWGTYPVIVNFSNRFQKLLPLLLDVEGFAGVRIHAGNHAGNTEGCILLGMTHSKDWVGSSQQAMENFMGLLDAAVDAHEPVSIEIVAEATT